MRAVRVGLRRGVTGGRDRFRRQIGPLARDIVAAGEVQQLLRDVLTPEGLFLNHLQVVGDLRLVAGDEGSWVELGPGKQWLQIDLGKSANIYAVLLWHFHSQARVYRDVIAQVSDDASFKSGVTTIFNNDFKNEMGLGAGKDLNYVETYQGKLIDAKGAKGRYIRFYSNGNTTNKLNDYIEAEVWGKPA